MPENSDAGMENELEGDGMAARSFWSGTLTFGLVSIPVALFPANRSQSVSLRMLAPDGTPLRREYFDEGDLRSVPTDDLVRGYEMEDGDFVIVSDDELEAIAPEKSREIDLRLFVPAEQIDPLYFDRAYYLTPGGESTKAYKLLAETMERTGRVGIATFVMRAKEYLIAIFAEGGIMRAETLRFADELRTPEDLDLPSPVKPKPALVKTIGAAIRKDAAKTFNPDDLVDRTRERLLEVVERKRAAGVDVIEAEGTVAPADDIIDLMEVLKRSLGGAGNGIAKKSTAKVPKAAKKAARKAPKKAAKKAVSKAAGKPTRRKTS